MREIIILVVAVAVIIFLMALKDSGDVGWSFWTTVEELKENMLPGAVFIVVLTIVLWVIGAH